MLSQSMSRGTQLLVSLLKLHGLATDVFSVVQWKTFFFLLLLKKRTYFSGLGKVCYGLGMVFIHNSFGNNTYNIRQQSCLQLFKRNLTPLLRQYNSGQRKFSWLLLSLKNRPHNCGGWKSSQKIKRSFSDKYLFFFFSPIQYFFSQSSHSCNMNYCICSMKLPSTAQLFIFVITGFYFICLPFDLFWLLRDLMIKGSLD